MEKIELVLDTFKGRNETHPLFSLWKHFPYDDKDPVQLANAHEKFFTRHSFDLMKISPHGRYPVVDFGCKVSKDYDSFTGSSRCEECCIKSNLDWETIEPVNVNEGEFGNQIKTVELINKKLELLPKMMTIFSPLMVASKMDQDLINNLRNHPKTMKDSLYILYEVMLEFALSSIDSGANGIFLASQHLRETELQWEEIEKYEIFFLKKIIEKIKKKSDFTVLHIHGENIFFKQVTEKIKADAYNWHDQLTWPRLEEAARISDRGLLAGIDETKVLVEGNKEKIKENILNSIKVSQKNDNRIIISPGCVIPITVSEDSIDIVSSTINKSRG
ncbi:MAG: uroporphyrinogen decarboxylase family protein [Candidatus Thorarchaeota archaeon]